MTARYLLDTSILSEETRAAPRRDVLARLKENRTALATAAPIWNELLFGCERLPASRRKKELRRWLSDAVRATLPILPYDALAAEWHASERVRLEAAGKRPPFVDGQIAAIAAVNGLVLVTANVKDFAGFQGLDVENWRD